MPSIDGGFNMSMPTRSSYTPQESDSIMLNELNSYDNDSLVGIATSNRSSRVRGLAINLLKQRMTMNEVRPTGPSIAFGSQNQAMGNMSSYVSGTMNTANFGDVRGTYADNSNSYEDVEEAITRPISHSAREAQYQRERQMAESLMNQMRIQDLKENLNRKYEPIKKSATPEVNLAKPKPLNKLGALLREDGAKAKVKISEIMAGIKAEVKRDFTDPFITWLRKK